MPQKKFKKLSWFTKGGLYRKEGWDACYFLFFIFIFGRQMVCLRALGYFQGTHLREHLCREQLYSPSGPEEGSPLLNFWTWVVGVLFSLGNSKVNPKDVRRNNHRNHNHTNSSIVLSTTNHRLRRGATTCQRNCTDAIPCKRREWCWDRTFQRKPIKLSLLQQYLGKNIPYIMCLNNWSPAASAVWETVETLGCRA